MMQYGDTEVEMADGWRAQAPVDEQVEKIDVALDSPAIRRLVEEVRAEAVDVPRSYNRTFNRHNR